MSTPEVVKAAGTVPWRLGADGLEVALVHRPAYDDWAWPKGKLDPDERWAVAAVRETWEEIGLRVRLGAPLPDASYDVDGHPKQVRYWSAQVIGGQGGLEHEVDEVAWLTPAEASTRLSYERDNEQLHVVVARHEAGTLETAPLMFVRHALAVPRKAWKKREQHRPLSAEGVAQAKALPPLLAAYGVNKLVSSCSERCARTFRWAEKSLRLSMSVTNRLTEEGFAAKPRRAVRALDELAQWTVKKNRGSALCTHGPLTGPLLHHLATDAEPDADDVLRAAASDGMTKGEAMAIHLSPHQKCCRVLAVERHLPWDGG